VRTMTLPQNLDNIDDRHIIAMTIDGEAENQGSEGRQAVGCVIQNRARFVWQGERSARAVCLHPYQFSCWLAGPDRERILSLQDDNEFMVQALYLADQILKNSLYDITGGADSYQVTGTNAYWSRGLTPVKVIGSQQFYITRNMS